MIKIKQATKEGYINCKSGGVADLSFPGSKTRRGRVQDNGTVCPTLTCGGSNELHKIDYEEGEREMSTLAIRKLTPSECFKLQGMTDEDFQKARDLGVSDSQLYKIAGNGLSTTNVQFLMEHLYKTFKPNFITTDERMAEKYGRID